MPSFCFIDLDARLYSTVQSNRVATRTVPGPARRSPGAGLARQADLAELKLVCGSAEQIKLSDEQLE
jgi:hypothetical protein